MRGAGGSDRTVCSQARRWRLFAETGEQRVTSLLCRAAAAVNSGSINQPSRQQSDQALLCVQVEEAQTHSASTLLAQEKAAWFGKCTVPRPGGWCADWVHELYFSLSIPPSLFPLLNTLALV